MIITATFAISLLGKNWLVKEAMAYTIMFPIGDARMIIFGWVHLVRLCFINR